MMRRARDGRGMPCKGWPAVSVFDFDFVHGTLRLQEHQCGRRDVMRDRIDDVQTKISDRDSKAMSMAFNIDEAKGMARFLLKLEHQGPGDTIEAAASRNQTKYGVPASILLRLWGREVNDMLLSNFAALAAAYVAVGDRVEKAYEHEKYLANNSKITRLADLVSGAKDEA